MCPFVRQALETLYGAQADALIGSIQSVLKHAAMAQPKSSPVKSAPLSQSDALLICYADQVQEPGVLPLRSLAGFASHHLKDLVSGIHLLPFYPWSSDDGFSVKNYTAADSAYGSWDDLADLARDFDLMFDAVVNHASVQGEWFNRFLTNDTEYRDFFVTVAGNPDLSRVVRPRALPLLTEFQTASGMRQVWTTFSADQADLNFKNPAVLLEVIKILLFYAGKGARFIRLDAIAFLWKEIGTTCLHLPQTHAVIQLLRALLDKAAPHVRLITETNVPHAENISYFGDGTNEAQLVYNFALPPLVLHSLQTGNASKLSEWAKTLRLPSDCVSFFNFLASHDGIGLNPARGILSEAEIWALVGRALERGGFVSYKSMPDGTELPYELNINYLDALSNPAADEPVALVARKFLNAQAIMLSLKGMPGIYFHSLVGSRGDRAAVHSTGIKRRVNREKLDRRALEQQLADGTSLRAAVFRGYSELLRARRANCCFSPMATQEVLDLDARVFAVLRQTSDGGERIVCLHNVSAESVALPQSEVLRDAHLLEPFDFAWIPQQQA